MKYFNKKLFRTLIEQLTTEGLSIRRKFALYILSIFLLLLALILILLNLFGILNPANRQIMGNLDTQLLSCVNNIEKDCDQLAAHAISFADQLEIAVSDYLTEQRLSFESLENNAEQITQLQNKLYDIVYWNMQLAPSSGAFYILNTSVNSHTSTPFYSAIYLKYINLYSENTLNNDFAMYRGAFVTGKNHDVSFHSGWKNEAFTDFFSTCDTIFTENVHYALSPVVKIPDTWERARYIYLPLHDGKEQIIGVCGFEMNDLIFQLSHKTEPTGMDNVVYGLLEKTDNGYSGQFNSTKYNIADSDNAQLSISYKNGAALLNLGNEIYVGKTKELLLGNSTFTAVVMIPQTQYNQLIQNGKMNMFSICFIIALFAFGGCSFITQKYMTPLLIKIEQINAQENIAEPLVIKEIDDLFKFLEQKDRRYEVQLRNLEKAKQEAEAETLKTKAAYELALEKYTLAKDEINQIAEKNKREIVLEDYEFFVCNLGTLTAAEYRIYELYLSGKNAKQIVEILNISENTLKYHNKNIYAKLGISSRKQLLRFASLKQHQDNQNHQTLPL